MSGFRVVELGLRSQLRDTSYIRCQFPNGNEDGLRECEWPSLTRTGMTKAKFFPRRLGYPRLHEVFSPVNTKFCSVVPRFVPRLYLIRNT